LRAQNGIRSGPPCLHARETPSCMPGGPTAFLLTKLRATRKPMLRARSSGEPGKRVADRPLPILNSPAGINSSFIPIELATDGSFTKSADNLAAAPEPNWWSIAHSDAASSWTSRCNAAWHRDISVPTIDSDLLVVLRVAFRTICGKDRLPWNSCLHSPRSTQRVSISSTRRLP
jgi:hypothetical protein